jgi:hypothetical protein
MKIRTLLAAGALMLVATAAFAQSSSLTTNTYGNLAGSSSFGSNLAGVGNGSSNSTQVRTQDGSIHNCVLPSPNQDMGKCSDGEGIIRDGRGGYIIGY